MALLNVAKNKAALYGGFNYGNLLNSVSL